MMDIIAIVLIVVGLYLIVGAFMMAVGEETGDNVDDGGNW